MPEVAAARRKIAASSLDFVVGLVVRNITDSRKAVSCAIQRVVVDSY